MIPLDYRSGVPDLSSSSPLHNLAALSSSPPLSPQSPTLSRSQSSTSRPNAFLSPISSNPDPFSGSAKAISANHPSFGKDQLRSKHLRADPVKAGQAGLKTWALPTTSSIRRRDNGQEQIAIDEALQQHFFDSSDDNPSSDWSIGAMDFATSSSVSTAPSSMLVPSVGLGIAAESSMTSNAGLRLGEAFQEGGGSPSIGRKASRVRTFSRTQSSSKDPFGASFNEVASSHSPKSSNRQTQRRRLTGTSPRKLSRAQFQSISSDDENSPEEGLPAWEQFVYEKPMSAAFSWDKVVEQVFEKVDGSIDLSKRNLSRIDPIIADLAKFVSIPPLRKEDNLPPSQGPFSRTSSSTSAFERTTSSTSAFNSSKSRSRAHTSDQAPSSKVQLYLAGNRLSILPSAFFELHNLVVLILRDNNLEELPPAIGQLVNLKELNVSQNGLRYLPAEIQKLNLDSFVYFPNAFLSPPADAPLTLRRTFGQAYHQESEEEQLSTPTVTIPMGPPALPARAWSHSRLAPHPSFAHAGLQSAAEAGSSKSADEVRLARYLSKTFQIAPRLPTLMDICIRVLLESEHDDDDTSDEKKILLEMFESGFLVNLNKSLDTKIIKALEAARRSAVKAWGRVRPASTREGTWCSGAEASESSAAPLRTTRKDQSSLAWSDLDEASNEESEEENRPRRVQSIEEQLDKGDDSRLNPFFNRCPNPRHYKSSTSSSPNTPFDWPGPITSGKVFYQSGIQRLEWVSHVANVAVSQIRLDDVADGVENKKPILAKDTTLIPLQWRGCGPSCLDFL